MSSQSAPASVSDLGRLLGDIRNDCAPLAVDGEVADYIPALAAVPADRFALVLSDMHGDEVAVGDADVPLSIQSVSKLFALTLAMQRVDDTSELWERVGREPSGSSFNSLVQLEHERGIPRNPFINSGAIVVADHLLRVCDEPRSSMLTLVSELAGDEIVVDEQVWASERETGQRNRAIGNLIASFGNLDHDVDAVVDEYSHNCSLMMTSRQLARAVRFIANDGIDPATGVRVVAPPQARRLAALMLTCGTYDQAGQFAFRVGIPCKSGVGGAIVGVVPGRYGVCVWSPPLDSTGNSLAGTAALTALTDHTDFSIF